MTIMIKLKERNCIMNRCCLLLLICFSVLDSVSYGQQNYVKKSTPLFSIVQNGKIGFIDSTGKVVIEPKYDNVTSFSEGLARVKIDEKYGFIDSSGKIIIEPQFENVNSFSDGLATFTIGDKWGFINRTGNISIEPKFDHATSFSEGLASVKIDKKYGFIDTNGNLILDPIFTDPAYFKEGIAHVKIRKRDSYIDKKGQNIIEPRYCNFAESFSDGLALIGASNYNDGFGSHIDMRGGRSRTIMIVRAKKSWMWFIDKSGERILNLNTQVVKEILLPGFSEGLAAVKTENKWGFIDKKGNWVLEPKFDAAWSFSDGLALVVFNGKYYYVDKTGNYVWDPDENRLYELEPVNYQQ